MIEPKARPMETWAFAFFLSYAKNTSAYMEKNNLKFGGIYYVEENLEQTYHLG